MPEEVFLYIKFKNRQTKELKDGYIRVPNIDKYADRLKKFFDIHQFSICEKRLISKEEFEKKKKS